MELINMYVKNKAFGRGKVIEQTQAHINVEFNDYGIKQFVYPDAFEKFLCAEDVELQKNIEIMIAEKQKKEEKERLAKLRFEEEKRNKAKAVINVSKKKVKTYPKANIAFKCNFCNGGCDSENIGFTSACSDEMIKYNIEVAHHNWCCSNDSPCMQYYRDEIDRTELDSICDSDDGFVCYESQMLKNWTAFAGYNLKGENKDKPMKLNKVQVNSLAVLTTRDPYSKEADRFIFGVFLIDDAYEGDNKEEGYVTTTSKYSLQGTTQGNGLTGGLPPVRFSM